MIYSTRLWLRLLRHRDLARQILFGGHAAHVADNGSRLPVNAAIYHWSISRALSGGDAREAQENHSGSSAGWRDKRRCGGGSRIHKGIVGRARPHGGTAPDRASP